MYLKIHSILLAENSTYSCLLCRHPFSPTNHLLIENHRSLIQICITPSLESTPWFIPSASPVTSRLTSSFNCQLISIIITTLYHPSLLHSFTPGSKPTFSTNPSHLRLLLPAGLPSWLIMGLDWTYHAYHFYRICYICCHPVSVRPSVRPSRSWVAPKRIKISSKFLHHRVATPFSFSYTKRGADIPTGTPLTGATNTRGYEKFPIFSRISRCISETVRWAHAARQFVSIEFSFHPYNI